MMDEIQVCDDASTEEPIQVEEEEQEEEEGQPIFPEAIYCEKEDVAEVVKEWKDQQLYQVRMIQWFQRLILFVQGFSIIKDCPQF